MFGEEPFSFRISDKKIDQKNRLIIPAETKVEENDKICIVENEIIQLYNFKLIEEKIPKLRESLLRDGKIEELEIVNNYIEALFSKICDIKNVDYQHRIVLPNDLIESYGLGKDVFIQGCYDHVNIFKDEESFREYQKQFRKVKK